MKSIWCKWTTEHHGFHNVKLTEADLATLSGAVHEFIDVEIDPETEEKVHFLPTLKYFFPAIPKRKNFWRRYQFYFSAICQPAKSVLHNCISHVLVLSPYIMLIDCNC
jgi:hypothetical protein